MLRLTFFGPFLIGCAAVALLGVLPKHAHSQFGAEGASGPGMGRGGVPAETEEQRFQRGIRRVVKSLEQAETEEEKKRLLELGRKGLEWRYQSKLDARKQELEKLRQRLAQLEDDYTRRTQAMPRVINLQLESLKLASEGLIDLEDVIGRQMSVDMGGYGGEMMGPGTTDMGGYGGGSMPPATPPIKPGEDPFEGLGAEEKKTSEADDAGNQGRTPKLPGTIAEPPSASTPVTE